MLDRELGRMSDHLLTDHNQYRLKFAGLKQCCGNLNRIVTKHYCQPQARAKAKAMPGRLYIHTINK